MQTADALRTPTFTLFPKPDYYFGTTGPNLSITPRYAYNHGYYSPNIDITWVGMAGPGVAEQGIDGPGPAGGNQPKDPNSTNTVPQASTHGTWVEEVDLRPTLLHLVGLHDDYTTDGVVVVQALAHPGPLARTEGLAALYRQLNSSTGPFATDALIADSYALASGSAGHDGTYTRITAALIHLGATRDVVAAQLRAQLSDTGGGHHPGAWQAAAAPSLLAEAHQIAKDAVSS
jgi:hypothetical protein